jgi:hypothetical protein
MRLGSGRTRSTALFALVVLIAAIVLTRPSVMGAQTARLIGSYALVGFPLFSALASWWCAAEMASMQMKVQWILLGAAALFFGCGQFLEEFLGVTNAGGVSVAEVLYLTAIVSFGLGVWMALRAFVGFLDVRKPIRTSVIFAAITSVLVAVGLAGLFARIQADLSDKILLAVYPLGILWLMAVPALALALTVSQMGGGSLARPWWWVFSGVVLITFGNIMLIVVNALGWTMTNAGPMEYGWWIGLSCIAIGAVMQIDVQKPVKRTAGQVS